MKYKLVKETKPTLSTYGKYKAVTCHYQTVESNELIEEIVKQNCLDRATVVHVMSRLSAVISRHLRKGDKVRLQDLGMMKLEIESDKVDKPSAFDANKHIRGVRLHFLPESSQGSPALYQNIKYEKEKFGMG